MKHVHDHLESGILFTEAELRARDEAIIDAAYRLYICGLVNIDGTYDYPYDDIIDNMMSTTPFTSYFFKGIQENS